MAEKYPDRSLANVAARAPDAGVIADDALDAAVAADLESEYEVLGELGRGGSAVVYRGRDRELGREVAIKVVQASRSYALLSPETGQPSAASPRADEPLARLAREARTVARLHHPNIVSVHAVRRLRDGGLALVMQLVPGRTLKQVVREDGPLTPARAEAVLRDVAAALAFAHAHGVVHRDVKPENIFLDAGTGRAMLSDFGIARLDEPDARLTQTGTTLGTPTYMSPEQIAGGAVDGRSDLYSLGLVLWETLTGRQPWEGLGLYAILEKQRQETLPPIGAVRPASAEAAPLDLQYVVERMLQKRPGARWPDAASVIAHLDHAVRPADYPRWLQSHARRVDAYRRAHDPGLGDGTADDAALATALHLPVAVSLDGTGSAEPDWSVPEEPRRSRRGLVVGAVLVALGLAAFGTLTLRDGMGARGAAPAVALARPTVPAEGSAPGAAPGAVPVQSLAVAAGGDTLPAAVSAGQAGATGVTQIATPEAGAVQGGAPVVPPLALPTPAPPARPLAAAAAAPPAAAPPSRPSEADERSEGGVPAVVDRMAIAAGGRHSCSIRGDGRAYCWGANDRGQLAERDPEGRASPARIAGDVQFVQLAAGMSHSCGVTRAGEAYCWGNDEHGELGDATTSSRDAPVRIAGQYRFRSVRTGMSHTCGVTGGGAVACWGLNADGQLGDGTTATRTSPSLVALPAGAGPVVSVSAGWRHSCAVTAQGAAYCWGDNQSGQLGDGSRTARLTPVPVGGAQRFASVAAGSAHTCAVTAAGEAFCWGRNNYGQLGVGGGGDRAVPTRVESAQRFAAVATGGVHSCARTAAGATFCWGRNVYGQLGDGTTADRASPVRVSGAAFAAVSATGAHTCGIGLDGEAACWGYNIEGQLGDGTRNHRASPVRSSATGQ